MGFNVNLLDHSKHCSIGFACAKGYMDCVEYLLQHGADINIVDIHGHGPLYAAASRGHLNIVKYLVENGADRDAKCLDKQWTPLQWAIYFKRDNVVEYLQSR